MKRRKTGMKSSHYTTLVLPPCKICAGEATGFHFGVITCEACKAFYRRSLVQKKTPKCKSKNNNCTISSEKNGNCAACRLKKCLENGMSKDCVRRGRFSLPLRTQAIVEAKALENKQSEMEEVTHVTEVKAIAKVKAITEIKAIEEIKAITEVKDVESLPDSEQSVFTFDEDCGMFDTLMSDSGFESTFNLFSSDDLEQSESPPEVWATETAIVPYVPPEVEGSTSLTQLLLSTDIGHGFVQSSEFEFLIDSLVGSQELVYPNLKRYFQQPLDRMHREIYVEFTRKQEIFEDVFGSSKPVTNEEFKQVFAETGLDIDERMQQFNMYGQSMEESIRQYRQFAQLIPGFYKLQEGDVNTLIKAGHLEFWFFGSHMLFNKELGVAMCWDGSQNGTKEHMTKFFDEEWIEMNFDFADTLTKLKLTFEEIVLIRAIILTSGDRGYVYNRGQVQTLQERYFECLRYYLAKHHPHPTKRLNQLFNRLLAVRNMTHRNIIENKRFLGEWGFLVQGYPLWNDMLTFCEL